MNQLNENYVDKVLEFLEQMRPGQKIETAKCAKDPLMLYSAIEELRNAGRIKAHEYSFRYGTKYLYKFAMKYNPNMDYIDNIYYFLRDFPIGGSVEIERITVRPAFEFQEALDRCKRLQLVSGYDFWCDVDYVFHSREPFIFDPKLTYHDNVLFFLRYEMDYYGSVVSIKKISKTPSKFIDATKTLISKGKIRGDEYILLEDGAYIKKWGKFTYNLRQDYDDNAFSYLFNLPIGSRAIKEIAIDPSRFIKSVKSLISADRISNIEYKITEDEAYIVKGNPV